jgi:hypothetical protein
VTSEIRVSEGPYGLAKLLAGLDSGKHLALTRTKVRHILTA